MRGRVALLVALAVLASTACRGEPDRPAPRTTTTSSTTTTPTTTAPIAGATACDASALDRVQPRSDRTVYEVQAKYSPNANLVSGELYADFTPDLSTDQIVMRLWPNGPESSAYGGKIELQGAMVDGKLLDLALANPTTAFVKVNLAAKKRVKFRVYFQLTLPVGSDDRLTRQGDVVRLGSWLPLLPWEPGVGWALDPPTTSFAEASLSVHADFRVRLDVPDELQVLAAGVQVDPQMWQMTGAPDWAAVIGRFELVRGSVGELPVTVGIERSMTGSAAPYLEKVQTALTALVRRYGAYPWPGYTLALTPGMRGGIEYPGLVMQGPNTNERTTPHEVAHQWFYALVGSNQGRDPWLDEGVATWAEAQINGTFTDFRTRAIPADGRNRIGEPMTFWDAHRTSYYRSVYVQGMQALAALGVSPDEVDCGLARYVAANAYRVATPKALATALATVAPNPADVLARFGAQRVS